ncbi:hypothetical protein Tco_0713305 [Tanacetum coccineum]
MANDDPILTTMRFIPQHEVVQRYGAILPDYLTNPAMKESEAYKTYHDLATEKVQPKSKYVRRSSRSKTDEAPKPSSGIKASKAMDLKGVHEGTGVSPRVLDVPTYRSDDEQLSWKSSDEENDDDEANVGKDEDDDDDERTKSENDGEYFVHLSFQLMMMKQGKKKKKMKKIALILGFKYLLMFQQLMMKFMCERLRRGEKNGEEATITVGEEK